MININIYNPIGQSDIMMSMLGMDNKVFSADLLKDILNKNVNKKDFKFNIHCNGGSVSEGLAIYDILRNSGKNIYMNIEGGCHSMAVTLLLAAPKNQRTANRNARALIHQVYTDLINVNVDQIQQELGEIQREQNTILDIYAERTGTDRATLENLMKQEGQLTAEQLLQYGFIGKINDYTTNLKTNAKMNITKKINDWKQKTKLLLNELTNFDFTDADGSILFSTDGADDTLSIGMPVTIPDGSTDGTFTLPDGRTVIIAAGQISDIQDPASSNEAEVEELRNQLAESMELINSLQSEITNLKNQKISNFKTPTRVTNAKAAVNAQLSREERHNELIEKRNKLRGDK